MEYILTIMVLIAIFVILSSSYNLVIGYGGLATVARYSAYSLHDRPQRHRTPARLECR